MNRPILHIFNAWKMNSAGVTDPEVKPTTEGDPGRTPKPIWPQGVTFVAWAARSWSNSVPHLSPNQIEADIEAAKAQ